jgi:hypothetical protein
LPVLSALPHRATAVRDDDAGVGGSGAETVGEMFVCEMRGTRKGYFIWQCRNLMKWLGPVFCATQSGGGPPQSKTRRNV